MQNLGILSSEGLLFVLTSLKKAKQGVSSGICFTLVVIDFEIVPKEFLCPMNLSGAKALGIHELLEVIMVSKYKKLVFPALQVMAPSLECLNNG